DRTIGEAGARKRAGDVRRRRWSRWRRRALTGLAGSAVLGSFWLAAPVVLQRLAIFRVRQVELVGVRNLTPDAVIAALRLGPRASVFRDTPLLADRVRGLAGGGGLDLPIAASADSGVTAVLALIQSVDPGLFQAITGARTIRRGGVVLEIGSRRVVVGRDAGPEVIRAVVLVAQDLAAKGQSYAELDARFAGQVVVRRKPTASKGGEGGA